MTCSELEPCPIYLEISHVYPLGRKLFATGNIHSAQVTLYSILLASEDNGATWHEGVERVRGGELDKIQFTNFETGWVSGQRVTPLPGDPFLLLTTNGGKTWRKQEILVEGSTGSVQKMWFSSPREGMLLIDRGASDGDQLRYSRYETMSGGTSWSIRETAAKPLDLPAASASAEQDIWRVRADASAKRQMVEKQAEGGWVPVSAFALELAVCKGEPAPVLTPPPAVTSLPTSSTEPKKDYVEELHLGPAPGEAPARKKKPK